jgi:CubicO group peptidase (beta-lactamase class C family)/D-alanyl-D-alanine dipeptidase
MKMPVLIEPIALSTPGKRVSRGLAYAVVVQLTWAAGLFAGSDAGAGGPVDGPYAAVVHKLEPWVAAEVKAKGLPALSIALVDDQRIVWARGFGFADKERRIPATAETVYRVGSVSKLFTDLAVMQLVEQGQLDLDAPVAGVLPEFAPHNPYGVPVTLRQLMSHRSGLVRESPVGHYFDPTPPSLLDVVKSLAGTTLVFEPGTRTKYSNAGIAVVGAVVEKVCGKPFPAAIERALLAPLGMKRSSFDPGPEVAKQMAAGLMWTYHGQTVATPTFLLGTGPAGNLVSSVADLGRFVSFLFADGRGPAGASIIGRETLRSMIEPQSGKSAKSSDFGLGFALSKLDGERMIGHGGAVYGFAFVKEPVVKPAHCRPGWRGLIGEYGWDHDVLYILERDGKLHALIEWFFEYPLKEVGPDRFLFPDSGMYAGEGLVFRRDQNHEATQAEAAGVVFKRRRLDGEGGKTFRITPRRPVEELRAEVQMARPPVESGQFRTPDLVELITLDPTIKLDIRYATTNNFLGVPLYTSARAFMERPAAQSLLRAHHALAKLGFGLLIHDAYRPWQVTKLFWEATPDSGRDFVADPSKGSKHNRGAAVDLTLYELATGKPVTMVGGYDEFSTRSYPGYPGGTSLQRWHREVLRAAMEAEGFTVNQYEWWHFDYRDWKEYPIINQPFEQLTASDRSR